jgi:hypothetical protein
MTGATLVSWGSAVPGRETKGLEVFMKAVGHFEGLAKKGRIHSHKEYISVSGNTGKRAGFMLIEGNLDELLKIQTEPETRRLLAQAQAITTNFTIEFFAGGTDRSVQEEISTYVDSLQELGYF